jgi:hypothetical protein
MQGARPPRHPAPREGWLARTSAALRTGRAPFPLHFAFAIVGLVLAMFGTELERVSEVDLCLRLYVRARNHEIFMPPPAPPPNPPSPPPAPPPPLPPSPVFKRDAARVSDLGDDPSDLPPDLPSVLDRLLASDATAEGALAWINWRTQVSGATLRQLVVSQSTQLAC